jgi:hypothetical protein
MNDMVLMQLLSIATAGLAILLNAGLVVVALVYVRHANAAAAYCLAAAGAIGAFGFIVRRLVGLVFTFAGGVSIFTASQIFATLLSALGGLLIPVAIFLLANGVKQSARQNP